MSATELELKRVAIGDDIFATRAWASGGPIVLVSTQRDRGDEHRSRLDLQKSMFIDPLPYKVTPAGMRALVARVIKVGMAKGAFGSGRASS